MTLLNNLTPRCKFTWIAIWVFTLMSGGVVVCSAQTSLVETAELDSVALAPPAPQSLILDEAGMFREHPAKLEEVKMRLRRMENDHGYPVYLAIYYNVYDSNLQGRADSLREAWIGESERGMVIVYQLDPVVSGGNPAVSYFRGSELEADLTDGTQQRLISWSEITSILSRVAEKTKDKKKNHVLYIGSIIEEIEGEINRYHEVQPVRWTDKDNLSLMAVFLGMVTVLTLLGMLLWKLLSKADAKSSRKYMFPEVHVGRRLEAPYGGGWISEKTFVPASSRK